MASSSLYKTFSLRTKEETNAFMKIFEEALHNPPKVEKSGVEMSDEKSIENIIRILQKQNGSHTSK